MVRNILAVPPPSSVTCCPVPSIVVLAESTLVEVMGITTGPPPHWNVTVPPPARAAANAASVQLPGVPLPTIPPARAAGTAHAVSARRRQEGAHATRILADARPSACGRRHPAAGPRYARSKKRKKRACFEQGAAFSARAAIWVSLSGVNSRASLTFSSSCATESQPMITVLTGSESV